MAPSPPQRTGTNNRLGAATRRAQFCRLYASRQLIAPRPCSETPGASRRKHAQFPLASAASRSGSSVLSTKRCRECQRGGGPAPSSTPWCGRVVSTATLPTVSMNMNTYRRRQGSVLAHRVRGCVGARHGWSHSSIRTARYSTAPSQSEAHNHESGGTRGIWRTWDLFGDTVNLQLLCRVRRNSYTAQYQYSSTESS
jgi:hypothetical protein